MIRHSACILCVLLAATPAAFAQKEGDLAAARIAETEKFREEQKAKEVQIRRERIVQLEKELRPLEWALKHFEKENSGVVPEPDSPVARHLRQAREALKGMVFNFPEKSKQAVLSGRALNVILEACGATCVRRDLERRQAAGELEKVRLIAGADARPADVPEFGGFANQSLKLSDELLKKITWEQNLPGRVMSGKLNQPPSLTVAWPVFLQRSFPDEVRELDAAFAVAKEFLEKNEPVSLDGADRLKSAYSALTVALKRFIREKNYGPGDVSAAIRGQRHVQCLAGQMERTLSAEKLSDLTVNERFQGRTIEELLAYMARNNLRFGQADANDEMAYCKIFDAAMLYYFDLKSLESTQRSKRVELAQSKADIKAYFDNLLSDWESEARKYAEAKAAGELFGAIRQGWELMTERQKAVALGLPVEGEPGMPVAPPVVPLPGKKAAAEEAMAGAGPPNLGGGGGANGAGNNGGLAPLPPKPPVMKEKKKNDGLFPPKGLPPLPPEPAG